MTLWNLIRDFLVANVFGGVDSQGTFFNQNFLGLVYNSESLDSMNYVNSYPMFKVSDIDFFNDMKTPIYISFGDWLSTTFTIITLFLLVIFLYIFVKWIFKLFAGLLH